MPMIDLTIPEGALKPEAEARLVKELGDILIGHEGFDPANPVAQGVTVVFLHRPAAVFVAGARSQKPRYRIVPSVPEGQYTDASRKALVKDVTDAVVRAEGNSFEDVAPRVWVFPTEVEDGTWGSRGGVHRTADIHAFIAGDHARKIGEERLARRRHGKTMALLEGMLAATRNAQTTDRAVATT
ncbi:Tautomerase enzyme [Bradyrhizobium sp. BR 10289]|uniref:tautomerase family protein n=1 Tax=Bradyrhizobium sp. BR 10289 TaxID=2749993 RepID=UPI001C6507CE|nr:Tautomerase enzyme [Bradyrhizobium sp. BR 10289]MBW7971310.1 tautomerase family protein [Bradyrhizobium sp. BR 10289]